MNEGGYQGELVVSMPAAEAAVVNAAQLAAAGMPLSAGLKASASESDSPRVRAALLAIAAELERGGTLEQCLAKCRGLPQEFRGAIAAAQRSGAYSPLLMQWLADRRAAKSRWRAFVATFSYPALATLLAVGVFLFFATFIVPVFRQMYEDFGLKLPAFTLMTLVAAEAGSRILFATVSVLAVGVVALRFIGGASGWSLIISSLPIVGLPWHWSSVAEGLRMLALLVEHRVPLGEALRLTAGALGDAYVARQLRLLAERVEQGTSLTMSLVGLRTLPLSIVPLVRWGERHGELAEALRAAAQMIEGRMNVRTDMLLQVIPPVLMIMVGSLAASMTVGLFLPLISLIQGLS